MVDIVALRPEVELCYMGVGTKCFEILETRRDWDSRSDAAHLGLTSIGGAGVGSEGEEDEDVDEEDDDDDVEELDAENSDADDETESDPENDDDDDDDDDDLTDSDSDSSDSPRKSGRNGRAAKLRLREILFYDDKVAVFKARHGKL